jgi:hypothetical protein
LRRGSSLIKKLFELVNILNGKPYDWYFKIGNGTGLYNYFGKRHEIIRIQIRDRIKNISPILYNFINETYKSQIRNVIAHSQYWFHSRQIMFNNKIENNPFCSLGGLSFEDWVDVFHNTLILHNQLIWLNKRINEFYGQISLKNNNIALIQVNPKNGSPYEHVLYYRDYYKDWGFSPE